MIAQITFVGAISLCLFGIIGVLILITTLPSSHSIYRNNPSMSRTTLSQNQDQIALRNLVSDYVKYLGEDHDMGKALTTAQSQRIVSFEQLHGTTLQNRPNAISHIVFTQIKTGKIIYNRDLFHVAASDPTNIKHVYYDLVTSIKAVGDQETEWISILGELYGLKIADSLSDAPKLGSVSFQAIYELTNGINPLQKLHVYDAAVIKRLLDSNVVKNIPEAIRTYADVWIQEDKVYKIGIQKFVDIVKQQSSGCTDTVKEQLNDEFFTKLVGEHPGI